MELITIDLDEKLQILRQKQTPSPFIIVLYSKTPKKIKLDYWTKGSFAEEINKADGRPYSVHCSLATPCAGMPLRQLTQHHRAKDF